MRNIHIYIYIESEYGKENVQTFRHWEKMEYKMVDFENHCRFSLRCLSKDIIPVSVRLKSNILVLNYLGYYDSLSLHNLFSTI